jgi:transcriptional regulator with XRE-family HTH domain
MLTLVSLIPPESPLVRLNREKGYNWTYAQIARAAGMDRAAVARLFERESLSPDFVTVWKLAKLFGVTVEEATDPAWFPDLTVMSPAGVQLAVEFKRPPRETLKVDGPREFLIRLESVTHQLSEERAMLGLPQPGRGRIGRRAASPQAASAPKQTAARKKT